MKFRLVNRSDARVIQIGNNQSLPFKSFSSVIVSDDINSRHLERDLSIQLKIVGEINDTKSPLTNRSNDFVISDSVTRLGNRWG